MTDSEIPFREGPNNMRQLGCILFLGLLFYCVIVIAKSYFDARNCTRSPFSMLFIAIAV